MLLAKTEKVRVDRKTGRPIVTAEALREIMPGEEIARGEAIDAMHDLYLAGTGRTVRWIAVRGRGPLDWAIYAQSPHYVGSDDPEIVAAGLCGAWPFAMIRDRGDKVRSTQNVRRLVDADDEAMEMYRS